MVIICAYALSPDASSKVQMAIVLPYLREKLQTPRDIMPGNDALIERGSLDRAFLSLLQVLDCFGQAVKAAVFLDLDMADGGSICDDGDDSNCDGLGCKTKE